MLKRLVVLCLCALPLGAQVAPSPNLAGIAHIALRVKDLDASIAFYEKLGFVKAFDLSRDGKVYEAFIKINDRQFIELYPVDAKNTQVGFLHVCFEASDIQSVHDYYVAQGLKPIDVRKAGAGNLLFTMPGPMTPQGAQNMEYTQYMPGSLHSNDFGKHLGEARVALRITDVRLAVNDLAAALRFYVDKAGFKPETGSNRLAIPGAIEPSEIGFVNAERQKFTALIVFAAEPSVTAAKLQQRNIPFVPAGKRLDVTDPDGNLIAFEPPRSSLATQP